MVKLGHNRCILENKAYPIPQLGAPGSIPVSSPSFINLVVLPNPVLPPKVFVFVEPKSPVPVLAGFDPNNPPLVAFVEPKVEVDPNVLFWVFVVPNADLLPNKPPVVLVLAG